MTATAIAENWAQLPFAENWKLYVSDVPYDAQIYDGDDILPKIQSVDADAKHIRHQLASLRAAKVTMYGSNEKTRSRNTVLVMVSVASRGPSRLKSVFRLVSKAFSIAVFVFGTAIFAAAQLLALPVATMTLTLILAAGVLSRAVTGWIVSGVSKTEPLIHVIVSSTEEAHAVLAAILSIDNQNDGEDGDFKPRGIQVELEGHVFINQKRVGHRSKWVVETLGVLAEPFDLRRVASVEGYRHTRRTSTDHGDAQFGLLQEVRF